jgi:hypothetical protein
VVQSVVVMEIKIMVKLRIIATVIESIHVSTNTMLSLSSLRQRLQRLNKLANSNLNL